MIKMHIRIPLFAKLKGFLKNVKTTIYKIVSKDVLVFIGAVFLSCSTFSTAFANPVGGQVTSGSATIVQTPGHTQINQTTDKAVINWQSFNIAKHESTHFQQPTSNSMTLNRINPDQGASQIFGQLTSNGRIILVNQAGIYFSPTAMVNVGGIVASTRDISDQNFLAGKLSFDRPSTLHGTVINQGTIIAAHHGLVALIGSNVSNEGRIQANSGSVVLASGNKFTVDLTGDGLVNFSVDEASNASGVDQNGNTMKHGVSNTGKIFANGGKIIMTAHDAAGVVDRAINMKGVAVAHSVHQHNGEIIFEGGNSGVVHIAGKVDVSGKKLGQKGGKVHITGQNILVTNANIDASGAMGGGEILVGGNYRGAGPLPNAEATVIDPSSILNASALNVGNGGKVIVWSNQMTKFYGNILAQGGVNGGNGGFVETSGKSYLESTGAVNANAFHGTPGTWLLDPYNVTIAAATANGSFNGSNPNVFTPTGNSATIDVNTINTSLNGGTSVTITTGSSGAQAGNITVSSAILKSAGSTSPTLTLNAAGSITVNNTISATSGSLNVTLIGDALTLNSAVTTRGGNFLSTTQNATTLANAINTGVGTVTFNVNQDSAGAQAFAMNAGSSITTTNTSSNAVAINVNAAAGGTGTAALRNITTGNGGTISVATNTGGNTTGGSITMPAGTLDVGTGTVSLSTSQTSGRAIGTLALPMQVIASNLNATTGSGGIFITNTGTNNLNLGTFNGTGSLTLTSLNSSGITNSGSFTLPGTVTIAAGALQDVTLNSASTTIGTLAITSGRNISLVNTGATALAASTISGTLNVTSGGTISETGALTVTGTPTFTLTTPLTDILLSTAANAFTATPVFTNNGNIRDVGLHNTLASAAVPTMPTGLRNVTLTFDNAGMILPALTLTGTLTATANGAITQTGPLAITGVTTLAAGSANNITLNDASNNFSTATITSGNNVTLRDLNALILGASTISGNLDVTTSGALTQSGSGGLSVAGSTTLAVGSSNNITLNTAANNFNSIGITTGNNVTLRDANSLVLNTSNIGGTLSVTTAGAITQTGPLSVTGATTLAAGSGNNITLSNANNAFTSVGITTGNNVTLTNLNSLILRSSTVSGNYNVTAGGTLSQNGVLNITGTPTFTLTTPNTDILLSTQANTFATTPVITNNSNVRDLSLRNISATPSVPILPDNLRNLTLTFNNAAMTLPTATISGAFTGTALGTMTVGGNFTTGSNSTVTVNSGTFTVANNATLTTNNTNFTITATDLNLNSSGALNLGTGTLNITQNTANGSIGLGNTAGTMSISGDELQRMTANILNVNAPSDGTIILDGITAANSANIGTVNFLANSGQVSTMISQNNPSSFRTLTASIDNGITIGPGAGITTTVGNMTLNGDAGGVGGTNNAITLNASLTAAGSMTLSAATNGIIINAPVTLTANGVTINHVVNGANDLVVNAGTGTARFQAAVGATTPLSSLTVTSGSNTTINQDINTTGNISFTSDGNITLSNTGSLNSSAGQVLLTGNNITLNSFINANAAGDSILIVDNRFTNNAGASALNPGVGNFQIWSANPANDDLGGLTYNFKQYNANYGSTTVQGTGNGVLYTLAPVITPELIGDTSKTYSGTNEAALTPSNYTYTGAVGSDTVVLNNPANGIYQSVNAGNNINVGVSGISIVSASDGNAAVYGYQIIPTATASIGTITPATLTYNANSASMNATNAIPALSGTVTGFVNNETLASATTGTLAFLTDATSRSIPGQYAINGSGLTANAGNYSFVQAPSNATALTIYPKTTPPPQTVVPVNDKSTVANVISPFNSMNTDTNTNLAANNELVINENLNSNTTKNLSFATNPAAQTQSVQQEAMLPSVASSVTQPSRLPDVASGAEIIFALKSYSVIPKELMMSLMLLSLVAFSSVLISQIERRKPQLVRAGSTPLRRRSDLPVLSFIIRNALNQITGFAELMYMNASGEVSPKQKEFISDIMTESNMILSSLEKIESDKVPFKTAIAAMQDTLRASLNTIIGFANRLYHGEVGEVSPTQKEFLENIISGSNDALQTVK